MKKSLIALAVLAASGAAMAQSSVTLYGIADIWFGSVKTDNGTTSLTQTKLDSGGVNGSRWGLKGSEDLGGGLKANFDLQAGINLDDGAGTSTTATAFSRQSWVGVSGGFGAVRLGRTTTPFDDVSGSSNAMFDSGALSPQGAGVFRSTAYSARQSNMFYYQAPNMGGFSGAISYSLGEDKASGATASAAADGRTADVSNTTSLNLTYAAGPLAVQFAYQVEDTNVIIGITNAAKITAAPVPAAGTTLADKKFTRLGASYNLGMATAKATYGKAQNINGVAGADATDWQLGVDVPLSAALTLSASYAQSDDNALAGNAERDGFGIGASYTLSKRTFLYGGYRTVKTDNVAPTADAKSSAFAVGMQHRF